MEQGYRQIFKQREFMKMTGANFINRFGDSIDMIAFTWLVFELTGSASWSAIMLGVNMIPNVLVQPFAGAIVERMEKKNIMIVCDVLRGILTASIAVSTAAMDAADYVFEQLAGVLSQSGIYRLYPIDSQSGML